MLRLAFPRFATKVVQIGDSRLVVVGIIRERLFGSDTIEEALRMVDNLTSSGGSVNVCIGINDQEFGLIQKSLKTKKSVKGKFMSPLISLCSQYSIPYASIGRRLTATSSRLSTVAMTRPDEFYTLLSILVTKSLSLIRTPQAREYLTRRVPRFTQNYLTDGSECLTLKSVQSLRAAGIGVTTVAVVPFENFHDIVSSVDRISRLSHEAISERIRQLDSDAGGFWIPVLLLYVTTPIICVYQLGRYLVSLNVGDLGNYETQGIALGTWVRDKSRD